MLKVLRDEYQGEVHISFGMTTQAEEQEVISFFEETNEAKNRKTPLDFFKWKEIQKFPRYESHKREWTIQ